MNRDKFIEYLKNPDKLNEENVEDIKGVLQEYPWFQTAHILLVKALDNIRDLKFGNQLKFSSAHIGNRHILFNLIHRNKYSFPVVHGESQEFEGDAGDSVILPETADIDRVEPMAGAPGTDSIEGGSLQDGIPETGTPDEADAGSREDGVSKTESFEGGIAEAGVPEDGGPETGSLDTADTGSIESHDDGGTGIFDEADAGGSRDENDTGSINGADAGTIEEGIPETGFTEDSDTATLEGIVPETVTPEDGFTDAGSINGADAGTIEEGIPEKGFSENVFPADDPSLPESEPKTPEVSQPEPDHNSVATNRDETLADRILREIEEFKKSHGLATEPPWTGPGTDSEFSRGSQDPARDAFQIEENQEVSEGEPGKDEGIDLPPLSVDAELLEIDKNPELSSPESGQEEPGPAEDEITGPLAKEEDLETPLRDEEESGPLAKEEDLKTSLRDDEVSGPLAEEDDLESPLTDEEESGPLAKDDVEAGELTDKGSRLPDVGDVSELAESHSFSDWLDRFQPDYDSYSQPTEITNPRRSPQDDLIDRFLREKPRIEPRSPLEDDEPPVDMSARNSSFQDEFLTETLARIYVQQKHYKRAIYAYEKLCLKYPEKYSYFADQIDQIKRFIDSDH
jgi:hypothetical protein